MSSIPMRFRHQTALFRETIYPNPLHRYALVDRIGFEDRLHRMITGFAWVSLRIREAIIALGMILLQGRKSASHAVNRGPIPPVTMRFYRGSAPYMLTPLLTLFFTPHQRVGFEPTICPVRYRNIKRFIARFELSTSCQQNQLVAEEGLEPRTHEAPCNFTRGLLGIRSVIIHKKTGKRVFEPRTFARKTALSQHSIILRGRYGEDSSDGENRTLGHVGYKGVCRALQLRCNPPTQFQMSIPYWIERIMAYASR